MHFGLNSEQELLQETLRRFAAEQNPASRLRECFDAGTGFDEALWRGAAALGLTGLTVPPENGGAGLELLDLALAFEVLGEAALPGPFLGHALATIALARGGDEATRAAWLPRLASGEVIATCALCERRARTSAAVRARATEDALANDRDEATTIDFEHVWSPEAWSLETVSRGGTERLTGGKQFCEIVPETTLLVVGVRGGRLVLVERDQEGVRIEQLDQIDRTRALAHVHFDQAHCVPLTNDPEIAEQVLDAARVLLAADAFGAAWRLIEMTVAYARQREQFSTPIAQFQAVKHQLAQMAMEAEPMRGLVWYAAYAFDHRPAERAIEAATAKAHVTDRVVRIGRQAVALHGGVGFTWECDVHFWLKRAIHDRTWLGPPEDHRARLASLSGW